MDKAERDARAELKRWRTLATRIVPKWQELMKFYHDKPD